MNNNIVQFNKKHNKRTKFRKTFNNNKKPNRKYNIFPVIICLVLGVSLFCAYFEMKKSPIKDVPSGYNPTTKTVIAGKTVNYDLDTEAPVKDDIWVMYQSLSSADKRVYDMFLDLVEHRSKGYKSSILVSDSTAKQLGDDFFWNVFYAMNYDHPEYFYLMGSSKIHAYSTSSAGQTTFVFEIDPPSEEENAQIATFEKATNAFMQEIDLTLSDREIELQIHDKLIQTVSYDYELYESRSELHDLGYTAYGALVEDSSGNNNMAVCEGYALAFEHLMHQAGIPCSYVSGDARHEGLNETDDRGHAWNVVKIDNRWYEVDTTWDDHDISDFQDKPEAIKKAFEANESIQYNYCHYYFNKTTKEMENMIPTDATVLIAEGYQPYNLRTITSHIRADQTNRYGDDGSVFLNSLVPIAE